VLARWAKNFIIATLVVLTGAHWAALQSVAWTTMLANNLRTQSVAEAVAQIFDGEHPCPLCRAIAAAKKSEKKSEAVSPALKMEFLPAPERFAMIAPEPVSAYSPMTFSTDSTFPKPPVPPPRGRPV